MNLYHIVKLRRQWICQRNKLAQQPSDGLHQKNILLSVLSDIQGILLYDLLDSNTQTITSILRCNQLGHLKKGLDKKRPSCVNRTGVILHYDISCPHIAQLTKNLF